MTVNRALVELLEEYGDVPVCGRCLVVIDARVGVKATHTGGRSEICETVTDPVRLKAWVIIKILERGWSFDIGDSTYRFIPISTWWGDPVCGYHLYMLVKAEHRYSSI